MIDIYQVGDRTTTALLSTYNEVMRSREEIRYIDGEIASMHNYYTMMLQHVQSALTFFRNQPSDSFNGEFCIDDEYSDINPTAAVSVLRTAEKKLIGQIQCVIDSIKFIEDLSPSYPDLIDEEVLSGE